MIENKIYCGLMWSEKGYPAYGCLVQENRVSEDKTFDKADPTIEIKREWQIDDYSFIKDLKKDKCVYIYTFLENKYNSFVKDLNRYKREENIDVRLRQTLIPAPEAAILKIKEFIKGKRLIFPEESLIRSQLQIFSKETLLDPTPAYAVRALCMVIGNFKKPVKLIPQEEQNQSAWW